MLGFGTGKQTSRPCCLIGAALADPQVATRRKLRRVTAWMMLAPAPPMQTNLMISAPGRQLLLLRLRLFCTEAQDPATRSSTPKTRTNAECDPFSRIGPLS